MSGTNSTAQKTEAFLEALSETASVVKACEISGLSRRTAYNWRDADTDFAAQWDAALTLGTDALEDEAVRRAREGTDKPVFYKGEICGHIREFSDTLLIFMLKARRPEKFRESAAQAPVNPDGSNGFVDGPPIAGSMDEWTQRAKDRTPLTPPDLKPSSEASQDPTTSQAEAPGSSEMPSENG